MIHKGYFRKKKTFHRHLVNVIVVTETPTCSLLAQSIKSGSVDFQYNFSHAISFFLINLVAYVNICVELKSMLS